MSINCQHFVYHLIWRGKVIYIGRSILPNVRRTIFERKHGFRPAIKIFKCKTLAAACQRELKEIVLFKPKFNKIIASSPARTGKKNSKAHNEALSAGRKGIPLSPEHKAKLWRERPRPFGKLNWFYGKHHTLATIAKVREASRLQFLDPVKRECHREGVAKGIAERRAKGLPIGRPPGKGNLKK